MFKETAKFQSILQFPNWRWGAWNLVIQCNCNMVLGGGEANGSGGKKKANATHFLEDVLIEWSVSQDGKDWLQSSYKPLAWEEEEEETQAVSWLLCSRKIYPKSDLRTSVTPHLHQPSFWVSADNTFCVLRSCHGIPCPQTISNEKTQGEFGSGTWQECLLILHTCDGTKVWH